MLLLEGFRPGDLVRRAQLLVHDDSVPLCRSGPRNLSLWSIVVEPSLHGLLLAWVSEAFGMVL